jgi:hypothetical protein
MKGMLRTSVVLVSGLCLVTGSATMWGQPSGQVWSGDLMTMDANRDGRVSRQEYLEGQAAHFDRLDVNHDGFLDPVDFSGAPAPTPLSHLATPAPAELPEIEVHTFDGIPYWSGGVGEGEREALKAMREPFNLMLEFSSMGHYLADISVLVTRANGQVVLEAMSQGPWFFTRLPPGSYTILAQADAGLLTRRAHVTAGPATRLKLSFPGIGLQEAPAR